MPASKFNAKLALLLTSATIALLINWNATAQVASDIPGDLQIAKVPMKGAGIFGRTLELHTEVFKPDGKGPFPVLIYAHGRSGTQQERSAMTEVVPRAYMQFWIKRGFAVVASARPGYGKTGSGDREMPGHSWSPSGSCQGTPNPEQVAKIAGDAVQATIDWVRGEAWANGSKIVLSGNSVGGLTTVSLGATEQKGVVAFINFAGGIAGNPALSPGKSCAPELVREAYKKYGMSARMPNLWIYAENDLFWGTETPKEWHAAFAAGGSKTRLVTTPPLPGQDGHELIFIGQSLWSPYVDDFLTQNGLNAQLTPAPSARVGEVTAACWVRART